MMFKVEIFKKLDKYQLADDYGWMIFDEYLTTVPEDNNVDDSYPVPGDAQEES